jgi:hypothetical protein
VSLFLAKKNVAAGFSLRQHMLESLCYQKFSLAMIYCSMEIQFIFFHGQLGGLPDPATGKLRLIVGKEGVAGQLPGLDFLPGAAVLALGFIFASRHS